MEELNNLYKRKYREVERKYQDYLSICGKCKSHNNDGSLMMIIDTAVRVADHNYRIFFERVESPSEFRIRVFDLLGSTMKSDLFTFYDRIGEKYLHREDDNVMKCCGKDLQRVSDQFYRCPECFNTVENYDVNTSQTTTTEKSNKYKRFDYFMEIVKTKQKTYNFKIPEEDMEILKQFFREVESNWHKVFPMKTFISYPFLFRKGLELLGTYDYILKIWKIKNSDENIKKNDQKWKKICEILNYEFISSG